MSRALIIRELAEMRLRDAAREMLDELHLVQLPTATDDHPEVADPPGWSGPCRSRGAIAAGLEWSSS